MGADGTGPPAPGGVRDLVVTLAGGGNRAFYQFGLLQQWGSRLSSRVAAFATCSAGACVAAMWLADRQAEAREVWLGRTQGVTRNLDWRRLLRGERPAPHGAVYRAVMETIGAGGGLERIRATPVPVLVLASAFPEGLPASLAVMIGIAAYQLERHLAPARLHPTFGRRLAFAPAVFDMRDCASPAALADLVLASSATPPFTPLGRVGGRRLLDGGLVDNAPAFLESQVTGAARNLVLLTRPYASALVGRRAHRFYVAPSEPPPLERWDYTKPHLLDANIALGRRDAERYWPEVEAFLQDTGRRT